MKKKKLDFERCLPKKIDLGAWDTETTDKLLDALRSAVFKTAEDVVMGALKSDQTAIGLRLSGRGRPGDIWINFDINPSEKNDPFFIANISDLVISELKNDFGGEQDKELLKLADEFIRLADEIKKYIA